MLQIPIVKKIIITSIIVSLALLLVGGVFLALQKSSLEKSGKVTVYSIPSSITITADDNKFRFQITKENREFSLPEGEYALQLSANGFENTSKKITVKKGESQTLTATLKPVSDGAKKIDKDARASGMVETIQQVDYAQKEQDFMKENEKLYNTLPLSTSLYAVDTCAAYRPNANRPGICISVDNASAEESAKQAMATLQKAGFNILDYDTTINNTRIPNRADLKQIKNKTCSPEVDACKNTYAQLLLPYL